MEFLSTPSGWRATRLAIELEVPVPISIHALRVEGDGLIQLRGFYRLSFLSTPSGWRATAALPRLLSLRLCISIHALRVEGDTVSTLQQRCAAISIHALRVEGDRWALSLGLSLMHFYPRPPGGGRRYSSFSLGRGFSISIHALRVEGDIHLAQM